MINRASVPMWGIAGKSAGPPKWAGKKSDCRPGLPARIARSSSESSLNAKDRNSVFHAKDRNKSRERQRLVRHCLHNRRGQFRTNSVGFGQIHFVLYLLVFSAPGPWVILFSRYRGSCLISCPSVVFASAQSASGELSGLISTVFYCW